MNDDLTRLRELRAKANGVITAMTSLVNELDAMLAAEPEPDPAPIQKPQPDWGRKGTQPTGTLGNPPPPNGRPVATKPTNAPAPYVVTDAMVEAAWAEFQRVCMWRDTPTSELRSWGPTSMRAALEAAERARRTGGQG
jgi:hypothetical protein